MMMKYLEDNGVAIKGENSAWGNFWDTEIDELTGYYVKEIYGQTQLEKFKNCNELENNKTEKNEGMLLTTASSEKVKKMNLYDVAGNLWEWTDEAIFDYNETNTSDMANSDYNSFVARGGALGADYKSYPVCTRTYISAVNSHCNFGFRVVLYIK